jgi:gamma-glutamyltranspeptidase
MFAKMQNRFSKISSVLIIGAICACVSPTNNSPSNQSQFKPVQADRPPQDFYLKSKQGLVAAGHPLASRAGARVLAQGGNAIDAAAAASFVISVVRPHSTGLGGGGFLLYFDAKSKESQVVDFRERAPAASSRTMFLDKSGGL